MPMVSLRWWRRSFRRCARTPSRRVPFRGPVARRTGAVFFSSDDDERNSAFAIFHGRVVDRHFFVARLNSVTRLFRAGRELIAQADVGECAAHHDFVIAAARAVGVEVVGLNAVDDKYFPAGDSGINRGLM